MPVIEFVQRSARESLSAVNLVWLAVLSPYFLVLLAADMLLFGLHFAVTGFSPWDIAPPSADWGRLDREGSVSERFETVKLTVAACVLAYVCMVRRSFALAPFVLIILYVVLDNAFEFHEKFSYIYFSGYQHTGEFVFLMSAGVVFAAAASIGFLMATESGRIEMIAIGMAFVLLGLAAAGIDALHELALLYYPVIARLLGLMEDGGELIAISIILAVCVRIMLTPSKAGLQARNGQLTASAR